MSYRKCSGTSKRTGKPCKARAMNGSNVCYHHGATSPKGEKSPHFKTGLYSKHIPTRMAANYKETQDDPELSGVREQMRLNNVFIMTLLDQLELDVSIADGSKLLSLLNDLERAYKVTDSAGMAIALRDMRSVITSSIAHQKTQADILKHMEQHRKFVETEQKIALQGERAVSVEQLMTVFSVLLAIIREEVSDQNERIRIADRVHLLIEGDEKKPVPVAGGIIPGTAT